MIKHVLVENEDRVSKILNTKVNYEEDLLYSNKKEVTEFFNKYSKYFLSNRCEDLKEFYNLTGIIVTRICELENNIRHIYSINNVYRSDINNNIINKPVYITHILVISDIDDNTFEYFHNMYSKNEMDYKLGSNVRYLLNNICCNIKSKIGVIKKYVDKDTFINIKESDVKDIYYTMLNNTCILLKSGDLYLDGRLYSKGVDTIWRRDSYTTYIIYKDNSVEELTHDFPTCNRYKYKKVVYNRYMLATLIHKRVGITLLVDNPDTSVLQTFYDVNDIKCTNMSLYLIKGRESIRIPCWFNTIVKK